MEESKLSRRDFLKLAGVAGAAGAVAGVFGPEIRAGAERVFEVGQNVVREAKKGFEQWSYGEETIRIDELHIDRKQLQTHLSGIEFWSYEKPELQEVSMYVSKKEDGSVQVNMELDEEKYYALPITRAYTDSKGKGRSYQTVIWMLETSQGPDLEIYTAEMGPTFFDEGLWVFAQGVTELTGSNNLRVYIGVGRRGDRSCFAGPVNRENKLNLFGIALDKGDRERIFKGSLTSTGPLGGLNLENIGAEAVMPLP